MQRFFKIFITIISILFFISSTTVCYAKKTHRGNLAKVPLYLKWTHQGEFAGYYYADKADFYKEQKLKVKMHPGSVTMPSAVFIRKVVKTPRAFGIASADQLLIARAHHVPVVAVATIYQQTPCVILSLKSSNITKPEDLIGKKMGIQYGTDDELIYRAILNSAGIDRKKVTEVPIQSSDALQYLKSNVDAIMAYSVNEPLALNEQGIETNEVLPKDFGIIFYSDTLFTSEFMLKYHPEFVRKFVQASIKGWEAALSDQDQAVAYTIEYNPLLNPSHEKKLLEASIPLIKTKSGNIGTMNAEQWKAMQDLLIKQHFIKREMNIGDVFTNEFLNITIQR